MAAKFLAGFLGVLLVGCSDDSGTDTIPDADAAPTAWGTDDGLTPPGPDVHFLTEPVHLPACGPEVTFKPPGGFSGGLAGTHTCGPTSPDCPTTYVPGNVGSPCDSHGRVACTGLHPLCLTGSKYPGGLCSSTGCELGSNFGCPEGAVCVSGGDEQTYCVPGCGVDQGGCFFHCARQGYSCFTTESTTLGTCFATESVQQCDPLASAMCRMPTFGDGICIQTSWDDQTVGRCFETCDPLKQNCSVADNGCYPLREYNAYLAELAQNDNEGRTKP